jgi:hypothetical protein
VGKDIEILNNKASNEALQALHGDLADIYLSQLKKLSYPEGVCVYIPFYVADRLQELIKTPFEELEEEHLIPLKDMLFSAFKGLSRDDISLLKNIQAFLKENGIEADVSKRPTVRSLRKQIKAELES